MDIEAFQIKITNYYSKIKSIDLPTDSSHSQRLIQFINELDFIIKFLSDNLNENVLTNYLHKAHSQQNVCPLDNLCKEVIAKLNELEPLINDNIFSLIQSSNQYLAFNQLDNIRSKIISSKNTFSIFEILKRLEGHNKTLIIIGPNGSGKTSFANYIKKLESHVKVIPASKPITAKGHLPSFFQNTIDNFNSEFYKQNEFSEDTLQKLIVSLCNEHDNVARKYYNGEISKKESIFKKVKEIFDSFFEVKLDDSEFSSKKIMIQKNETPLFEFNNMSDGERTAFFYIATVMTAPEQSFIVVDEPENHLNPAVYNKIWDKLISQRTDCQFIFISHTIDFIYARTNFELVKIKTFTLPNTFEFEFLGNSFNQIPLNYLVEIVGSRKPILFCEGTKSGLDYKIYEKLFGENYTIIAVNTCKDVEHCVETCNLHTQRISIQSAIGIIDSDLKTDDEISSLKSKKIYVLKCNEIEMLLLDNLIFISVLKHIYKQETYFEQFKNNFFIKINERKDYIIKRLVKTEIDNKLKNTMIDDKNNKTKEEIKSNLSAIFNQLDVDAIWNKYEKKLLDIIQQHNYNDALRYCCLEHKEILNGIAGKIIPDYANIALGILKENDTLSNQIKSKYFPEIFNN